jgi:hypothetical protein
MATYEMTGIDWPTELAAALNKANDGDVILVQNETRRQLAERAAERMGKQVTIKVGQ